MSKSFYSVEQRLGLINDCYTSGLSVYAWCKEKQIAPGTFYSWIHHLKKQGCTLPDVVPESLRGAPEKETHEIVKVNIVEETKFMKSEPNPLYRERLDIVCGRYRRPRDSSEVKPITWQQFDWLMSGLYVTKISVMCI